MINMEQLWKDYMSFEQNINPIIAEKMAIERSRDYMNARRVAKELEAVTRGLNRSAPSIPPTGHPEEVKQVLYFFYPFPIQPYRSFFCLQSTYARYFCYVGRVMEKIHRVGT